MYGDSDCDIRIQRHQNGYTVRITDPAIVKANKARDEERRKARNGGGDCCPSSEWRDPQVSYAFTTREEVSQFIKDNIDKALPVDEFSSSFDKAVKDKS
jgi:hypothetical protein